MRHRAWSLLLIVPAALLVITQLRAPFPAFHQHLTLAGTPERFAATVVRAGRSNARGALWIDNAFATSWLVVVPRLLRAGLERWAPERRRLGRLWLVSPVVAVAAGVADLVENAMSLFLVGKERPSTVLTLFVTTVSWSKLMFYALGVLALMALVVGPLVAAMVRPSMRKLFAPFDRLAGSHPPPEIVQPENRPPENRPPVNRPPVSERGPGERIGISLSGGGIRSASVAIGVLRRLDASCLDGPSVFARSRWLVAASGGAFTAGGWRVTRRPGNRVPPVASSVRDGLFDADGPWSATVRTRRRYLENGRLALFGGVVQVVVRTVAVFGAVLSAVHVVAWSAGRITRTHAVHPWFPFADASALDRLALRDLVPPRLVVPGMALLLVAASIVVVGTSRPSHERGSAATAVARWMAVAGAGLTVLLVGVPVGVVEGRRLLTSVPFVSGADAGAGLLVTVSATAVAVSLAGIAVGQLKQRWMRLGGVVLAVGLFFFAGKVADSVSLGYDGLWSTWTLGGDGVRVPVVVLAIAWLVVIDAVASHRLTLGGVYRKRLAATFALDAADLPVPGVPLVPLPYHREPVWSDYVGADGPELIVAATAHTTERTFCGLPAYGFTFRPGAVTLHDRTDGTSAATPMATYPRGSWWDGFPRGWLVSRSMALSGAAFASAMGRQALGGTQALLVAFDLRLGAWVPNPRFVHWFADPDTSPRVHLGYLAKEFFGRYHPERDPFVYVADGGHRDNLALVELLRERPDTVFCIDASGNRPGSFATLQEAVELARVELDVDIDLDIEPLRRRNAEGLEMIPLDSAVEGVIRYPEAMGGGTGRLLYGRAQLSEEALPALVQYGGIDARFPDYSTADQFLTEIEHLQLVALGEHVGDRMVGLFDRATL